MAIALIMTGWWMYIDVPETPRAVVACVIIFNAAFGYSWGPIPWLYPPEVGALVCFGFRVLTDGCIDHAFDRPRKRCFPFDSHELGIQLPCGRDDPVPARSNRMEIVPYAWLLLHLQLHSR